MHEVFVEALVPASATQVWEAFTDPSELAAWFWPWHAVVRFSPIVGAEYSLEAAHPQAGRLAIHGTIIAAQPPKLLVLTWIWTDEPGPATSVEITIDGGPEPATVSVRHQEIETASTAEDYRHAWTDLLARLRGHLARQQPANA